MVLFASLLVSLDPMIPHNIKHNNLLLTPFVCCKHAAGMLQAKQKSYHWYEIKPVQENYVNFSSSKVDFLMLKATIKQNLFLKAY